MDLLIYCGSFGNYLLLFLLRYHLVFILAWKQNIITLDNELHTVF